MPRNLRLNKQAYLLTSLLFTLLLLVAGWLLTASKTSGASNQKHAIVPPSQSGAPLTSTAKIYFSGYYQAPGQGQFNIFAINPDGSGRVDVSNSGLTSADVHPERLVGQNSDRFLAQCLWQSGYIESEHYEH